MQIEEQQELEEKLILLKQLHLAEIQINDLRRTIIERAKLQDQVIKKLRERIKFSFRLARTLMNLADYKSFVAKMDLQQFGDQISDWS